MKDVIISVLICLAIFGMGFFGGMMYRDANPQWIIKESSGKWEEPKSYDEITPDIKSPRPILQDGDIEVFEI